MGEEKQIEYLALLQALKLNLPDNAYIEEHYVQQFHQLIDRLSETSGRALNSFRVTDSDLTYIWVGQDEPVEVTDDEILDEDQSTISDYRYCARNRLATLIDGVLISFNSDPPRPTRPIGFTQE
jgi:hypothetical protein